MVHAFPLGHAQVPRDQGWSPGAEAWFVLFCSCPAKSLITHEILRTLSRLHASCGVARQRTQVSVLSEQAAKDYDSGVSERTLCRARSNNSRSFSSEFSSSIHERGNYENMVSSSSCRINRRRSWLFFSNTPGTWSSEKTLKTASGRNALMWISTTRSTALFENSETPWVTARRTLGSSRRWLVEATGLSRPCRPCITLHREVG